MYQFCVSGAAAGESVKAGAKLAQQVGTALAVGKHILLTGATTGIPEYAAKAYKKAGGKMSLGVSPASTKIEHIYKYRLPTDPYDMILYTGLHYVGRDALLINSADAVISIGGRLGTLHEFTIAMETETPIGFLHGAGGIGDEIKMIMEAAKPVRSGTVFYSDDVADLIKQITSHLNRLRSDHLDIYK